MALISFKPEILDRIIPDVSLERHVKTGIRSNQRKFDEFKPLEILSKTSNHLLTSSHTINGNTLVLCNITYGITEAEDIYNQYSPVYPTVSVSRGRIGAPTDEEMNLSQRLYDLVLTSKLVPMDSLVFTPKVLIDDQLEDAELSTKFKFNLYVNLKVFDRSGPLFDVCHYSLISCLKQVKLPTIYLNDSFNKLTVENLVVHPDDLQPLKLNFSKIPVSSNFGIVLVDGETSILYDIENESEEYNILTKANVVTDGDKINEFSLTNGNLLNLTKDNIRSLLNASTQRARQLNSN